MARSFPREPVLWNHVLDFIKTMGFDQDEYFSLATNQSRLMGQEIIWKQDVSYCLVFWVNGTSEGYYVHVCIQIHKEGQLHDVIEPVLYGKFYSVDRAELAATSIQRYVNGWWKLYPDQMYYVFYGTEYRGKMNTQQAELLWAEERPMQPVTLYKDLSIKDDDQLPDPSGYLSEEDGKFHTWENPDATKRIGEPTGKDDASL